MTNALVALSQISRSGWTLSWLLLALYALPVFVLVYRLDLYEREPISLAVAAFLWGAFAATALALDAAGWDRVVAQAFGQGFAAPVGSRAHGIVHRGDPEGRRRGAALPDRARRDRRHDGRLRLRRARRARASPSSRTSCTSWRRSAGTPAGVLQGFYVRVLSSGLYGHVLYTGLMGMGIGYFVSKRERESLGEAAPRGWRARRAGGRRSLAVGLAVVRRSRRPTRACWLRRSCSALKALPLVVFVVRGGATGAGAANAGGSTRRSRARWVGTASPPRSIGRSGARSLRRRAVADMRRRAGRSRGRPAAAAAA